MALNFTLCLVGAMDRLWFHHIIPFSEPISLRDTKTIKAAQLISDSITYKYPSSNFSQSSLEDQEETPPSDPDSSQITPPLKDDFSNGEEEKKETTPQKQERPTRRHNNLTSTTKTRSHSSSPSTQKRCKKLMRSYSSSLGRLENTMSCKSLGELELEELKGFMDLGFTFKKEEISPRIMNVIPGLKRLEDDDIEEDDEEEDKRGVILRPYLSEAWLIKRPNSPLLNLRIPRAYAAADMKKHLRFWARTVASEILQES